MELKELEVSERVPGGSSVANRLRRSGGIPGVVYSGGKEAQGFVVDALQFQKIVGASAPTQLFKLKSGHSTLNGLMVLVKDMQHEPIKDKVLHVDFLSVSEHHRITVTVPIKFVGESEQVKTGEMILNQTLYDLEVDCLPLEIPDHLTLDITNLRAGHSLHARDIALPGGVKLRTDGSITVATLLERSEEEAAPVAAAATATPAAGEAAAAPAAGAAEEKKEEKAEDKKGK